MCCKTRLGGAPRTSLRRIRLEPKSVLAEAKKHRLCPVDAEESIADRATDFRVLELEMAPGVFLEDAEHFVHLPLIGRAEQDVGDVEPPIRAVVAKDGECAVPERAKFGLEGVAELLFADFGHTETSFQGSELSSHDDPISMYSSRNNTLKSTAKSKTETQMSFCSGFILKNFSFLLLQNMVRVDVFRQVLWRFLKIAASPACRGEPHQFRQVNLCRLHWLNAFGLL